MEEIKMKKMLTVVAGVLVAGSLMSSVARADMMVGQDKSTWSPYPIETEAVANAGVITGQDESSWSPYPIEGQDEKVGMPSPFTEVKSLKEAEKKTGVKMTTPKKIKGYDEINYEIVKKDKFIQVNYRKDDNNSITIRKGETQKDVSGDYNKYKNTKKITVKSYKVKLQGNDKTYSLATWTKGKYSYSVGIYHENKKGMSLKQIKNIIGQVK